MRDDEGREGDGISISTAVAAAQCPVRVHLDARYPVQKKTSLKYTICRQISAHLGDSPDSDFIWDEVRAICPGAGLENRKYLESCLSRCLEGGPWPSAKALDVMVRSHALNTYGLVDKVCDGEPAFFIVRAAPAPPAGLYRADRLRVAGCLLCLREMEGAEIQAGGVEYIESGTFRACTVQPIDKRRFLHGLAMAKKAAGGAAPVKPPGAPCRTCRHQDRCCPPATRLSDLL
jgi:CRISPR-associated exonuclease Cas4